MKKFVFVQPLVFLGFAIHADIDVEPNEIVGKWVVLGTPLYINTAKLPTIEVSQLGAIYFGSNNRGIFYLGGAEEIFLWEHASAATSYITTFSNLVDAKGIAISIASLGFAFNSCVVVFDGTDTMNVLFYNTFDSSIFFTACYQRTDEL
jgi:hypothetical protein